MKVAYIMFTNGLEYDDRIRKEMLSMRSIADVEFKIFAFHAHNHIEKGVLSYGVPYEFVSVKGMDGNKGIINKLRKEYNFYSQIAPKVRDYDLLWIVDDHPFFFPLFSKKKMVWDLHEIPERIIGGRVKNTLFHRMERRCPFIIHANQDRLDYLTHHGVVLHPEKHVVLRNYPDRDWLSHANDEPTSYLSFRQWLGESEYVYIQGLNNRGRYPIESLSAIMETKSVKAVVVGDVSEDIMEEFVSLYPDYKQQIYFAGQMIQSDTAPFIANCMFSMVFYSTDKPNNRYCEPNRMFQSLGLGKPVLVGCNEPMRNVVEKYENGVVLDSNGRCISDTVKGIKRMLEGYTHYKDKAEQYRQLFNWESQIDIIKNVLDEK